MITRAIVEEVISPYKVKVRIPLLNGSDVSHMSTNESELNIATICSLPNCYVNIQPGDVVFVGFEDNTYYKSVVLGHMCREATYSTYVDLTTQNIVSLMSASLPYDTTIGDVSSRDISTLEGTRDNIQKQLDNIQQQITSLREEIFPLKQ